jgi:hypothetical protein
VGQSDGTVLGATKIVDNGDDMYRWNLVIAGDGFRSAEMPAFETAVDDFVAYMQTVSPFSAAATWADVNVHRLDVASDDSGADNPNCDGTTVDTYFDAEFCVGGLDRTLVVNELIVMLEANAHVPEWDALLVFVNHTVYGGVARGGVAAASLNPLDSHEVAMHETGHAAFELADEYNTWAGCDSGEVDHDVYPVATDGEPVEANVTANTDRATLKWADLVDPATPIPTTSNADCTRCDTQPNPLPAGTVGLFEGARYFHCGCHRPEFDCRMNHLGQRFCAVCRTEIANELTWQTLFDPSPCFVAGAVYGEAQHLDVATLRRWRDVRLRRGNRLARLLDAGYDRVGPRLAEVVRGRPHLAAGLRRYAFAPLAVALRRRPGALE